MEYSCFYHAVLVSDVQQKMWFIYIQWNIVVAVQSLSHVWLFATPWTAAHEASPSLTISQSWPKFMPIASVMASNHLTTGILLSLEKGKHWVTCYDADGPRNELFQMASFDVKDPGVSSKPSRSVACPQSLGHHHVSSRCEGS